MTRERSLSMFDIYHVVARGASRQLLFEREADYDLFLSLMKGSRCSACSILAWCLMSNHVHLLLQASVPELSVFMRNLCSAYAKSFNRRYERTGHLFQGRFTSEPVNSEAYFLQVVRYIHLNPEKAKIAPHDRYKWSSYREFVSLNQKSATLSNIDFTLNVFGGKQEFIDFHTNQADADNSASTSFAGGIGRHALNDSQALALALEAIGGIEPGKLKGMEKKRRNAYLARLRGAGLSVRQIERLTGVGRGIVQTVAPERIG